MKQVLLVVAALLMIVGCEAGAPMDQGQVMKDCAAACKVADSKMSKWNVKEGCVCDTTGTCPVTKQ